MRNAATPRVTPPARRALGLALMLLAATCAAGTARAADNTALRLANVSAANTAYVRIPHTAAFSLQQFTVEAWVQRVGAGYGMTTDGVGGAVVAKPAEGTVGSFLGPWYLLWDNSGRAFVSVAHTAGTDGVVLQTLPVVTPLGLHHLAAVVSADSVKLYVDGVLGAAAPWTLGTVLTNTNDVLIGACNFGAGYLRRLDGNIDDVRIWNYPRTASQISSYMNCRLVGNEPGLVAYYRFDASTLADDTGHGHTGAAVATSGALTYTALATPSNCTVDVEPLARQTSMGLALSPQPTRGRLRVRFALPAAGPVTISVYDVAGRRCMKLAEGTYEAGEHVVDGDLAREDSGHRAAGVRFIRLECADRTITRMVVVTP